MSEEDEKQATGMDLDAMLSEAGLQEPEEITLRWRGKDWKIKSLAALDPRLLAKVGNVEEITDLLTAALGSRQFKKFPMPRTLALPDGRTEMGFFLDAWAEASNEAESLGGSEPSPS